MLVSVRVGARVVMEVDLPWLGFVDGDSGLLVVAEVFVELPGRHDLQHKRWKLGSEQYCCSTFIRQNVERSP